MTKPELFQRNFKRYFNGKIKIFDVKNQKITTDYLADEIIGFDETLDEECLLISTRKSGTILYEIKTGIFLKTYKTQETNESVVSVLNFENKFFFSANCENIGAFYDLLEVN